MRRLIWKLLLCCLLATAILAGCRAKKSILLEDTLCEPPCWQNIIPGFSSSEDALVILRGTSLLASTPSALPRKIDDFRSYNSWNFQKNMRERGGVITYFNDTVAYIEFDVRGAFRIGEMIDYYGEPELFSAISGWHDSRWLRVCWIYPTQGILITHFNHNWRPSGEYARLSSNLPVDDVYYFDPDLYDLLVETVFFQLTRLEVVQASIQPWVGYGLVTFVQE